MDKIKITAEISPNQTLLILDSEDIAFVIKSDGKHNAYVGTVVNEDAETEQNALAILVLSILNNPELVNKLLEVLVVGEDGKEVFEDLGDTSNA